MCLAKLPSPNSLGKSEPSLYFCAIGKPYQVLKRKGEIAKTGEGEFEILRENRMGAMR